MLIDCDTDRFVREVIEGNEYSYMFRDFTVVDVGCNIGTFSMWIYPLAKKIYAIDFAQENINAIKKNIEMNDLKKIIPLCFGIGGYTGERYIEKAGSPSGGSWHFAGKSDSTVQVFSFGNFMSRESLDYVDILKLDVEGAEEEILLAEDFPFDRVGLIVGETHGQGTWLSIKNILNQHGYKWTGNDSHFVGRKK